ncbi:MAG: shikimate kinase [Archaeoglobaceae archaeon]|uniref:Shikimate kinase n=1 Tax=Archaeoglobus fulgidus TaxID=2234 RepID=A0A7J3M3C0_ARCFL
MKAKAYAKGTILNALATGIGSAFAIDLTLSVRVKQDSESCLIVNGEERDSSVAEKVLKKFGIKARVKVKSEIPEKSGLGSSSAFLNALICAVTERKIASEILSLNSELSLKAGISYTGAFDDASASLLGGFVISDNYRRVLWDWVIKKAFVAVLLPEFRRKDVDFEKIQRESYKLKGIDSKLRKHEFFDVMRENTIFYAELLGYPLEIVEKLWKEKICCGLSGNGPAFVAFGTKSDVATANEFWSSYGKVLIRKVPEKPAESIVITPELFVRKEV